MKQSEMLDILAREYHEYQFDDRGDPKDQFHRGARTAVESIAQAIVQTRTLYRSKRWHDALDRNMERRLKAKSDLLINRM